MPLFLINEQEMNHMPKPPVEVYPLFVIVAVIVSGGSWLAYQKSKSNPLCSSRCTYLTFFFPVVHDSGVSDDRHSAPQLTRRAVDWDADYWAL